MPAVSVLATTSTQIVPESFYRTLVLITNSDATANLHIAFGSTASTNEGFISPLGNMTLTGERCKCAINGISSSGTITAKYSVLNAG